MNRVTIGLIAALLVAACGNPGDKAADSKSPRAPRPGQDKIAAKCLTDGLKDKAKCDCMAEQVAKMSGAGLFEGMVSVAEAPPEAFAQAQQALDARYGEDVQKLTEDAAKACGLPVGGMVEINPSPSSTMPEQTIAPPPTH